ncbi:MAG: 16S rRNA (uracil(1498)-N(3))-methyltransferase [bacterium]
MKIHRFYAPLDLNLGDNLSLPDHLYRHAVQVLRLTVGEVLILFNGQGGEYLARLTRVEKRQAFVAIEQFNDRDPESPLALNLVQSLIKPDKMDWCIQKSVELGVHSIRPIMTERSVVKLKADKLAKKYQHWQGIIIAACEQSGRTRLPELLPLLSLQEYLLASKNAPLNHGSDETVQMMMSPSASNHLQALSTKYTHPKQIALLVGPEGGFTDQEVSLCLQQQVEVIAFGTRILRAETAALSGLSLIQHYWGDLSQASHE